jgi:hypothetical protein
MAAANESQGLKIAVAAFVTLTVVLAVTTYFGYSGYSQASEQLANEKSEKNKADATARTAVQDWNDLKKEYGYEKLEDPQAVRDAIKKDRKGLDDQVTQLRGKVTQALDRFKAAGGNQQKVDELNQAADQIVNQFLNEPSRTAMSTLSRLIELFDNTVQMTNELAFDNEDLRKQLAEANGINNSKLDAQTAAAKKSADDLEAETKKHEDARQGIMEKHDRLATLNNQQAAEINKLKQEGSQQKENYEKRIDSLLFELRSWRQKAEASAVVLDQPDGKVTFVDYGRNEVRTNVTRGTGAREQMVLTIFDRNSPGLPTDNPKGTIQLLQVGSQGSLAKILETKKAYEPIRVGDLVYSAAWSPNQPERFALIGKIDIDRDGRDDRDDLKRMIVAAGGIIDYDLPPPSVGQETGKITPRTTWYVLDDREPIHPAFARRANASSPLDDPTFLNRRTEAERVARADGVRPMSIQRILAYLGYTYGQKLPGRTEMINREGVERIVNPRGRPTPATTTPPPTEQPKAKDESAEEKKDDEPAADKKDEAAPDEAPK